LRQAAAVNPEDKFELVFRNLLERLFIERMDPNEEIFVRFMNDASFRKVVTTPNQSSADVSTSCGSATNTRAADSAGGRTGG
jgi:hypothetical protein